MFETNSCRICSRNQEKQVPLPPFAMFSLQSCQAAPGTLQMGGRGGKAQNLGLSHILCPWLSEFSVKLSCFKVTFGLFSIKDLRLFVGNYNMRPRMDTSNSFPVSWFIFRELLHEFKLVSHFKMVDISIWQHVDLSNFIIYCPLV